MKSLSHISATSKLVFRIHSTINQTKDFLFSCNIKEGLCLIWPKEHYVNSLLFKVCFNLSYWVVWRTERSPATLSVSNVIFKMSNFTNFSFRVSMNYYDNEVLTFLIWNKGSGNRYLIGEPKLAWTKMGMFCFENST